jgi:signal transduction histidine kinase/DNA-binding response OmpR family regulator
MGAYQRRDAGVLMAVSGERLGALNIAEALRDAGDVGRDLLHVDWSATPLGAPESWPRSLSTIARVVVSSRFSMWMAWGPELTFFCNEAYRRDTLGTKYPWALGRPAREVWAEIWDDIGPRIETVLRTGVATWDESLMLFLERSGYTEETYHTFSYSPLTDDLGAIVGMLCVVTEETEQVVGERRMATLRELGSESTTGRDEREYLRAASRHLAANSRSLPFTLTYLFGADGSTAELVSSTGISSDHPAALPTLDLHTQLPWWPLPELRQGRAVTVDAIDRRFKDMPTGFWELPPTTAAVLPLPDPLQSDRPYGFLVVGVNRYRPLDDQYLSFLSLIAAQLASGISSARAYEEERRRAEDLAELDRAKTAFFTNVSHELRTPLTLLLGPAEDALADSEQLAQPQRQRLEMIARNGERLLKLVNALLDFSRLESGRAEASFEPIDLPQYTAELASMFDSAVERAGLDFEIECAALDEPVYVDREMWAKVVLNLLSNALKFTFQGGITVRLDQVGRAARLAVADTGTGIEPSEQARLFERFHRVPGVRARTHEGSGIGLALVAELAQLHGGVADVQSTPGVGSTFTVQVPFGHSHLPNDQLARDRREVSVEREVAGFLAEADRWLLPSGPTSDEPDSSRLQQADRPRVLVVDDNADMRDYVVALLGAEYTVQTASDGEAALRLARADPPDLVLTDVMMPGLDGFGLLAALHADPATLQVPVVMLSARAGEGGVVEGLEAGADDYLIKPFSARELLARVRANLELDRARRIRAQLERGQAMQNQAERLAGVGSWEIDLSSGALHGSEQLYRLLKVSEGRFESLDLADAIAELIHAEDRERLRLALDSSISNGEPFEYEGRLRADESDERWVRIRGEVGFDGEGRQQTLSGFIQDITQRRAAELAITAAAAAREAAAREHAIADSLQRSLLPAETFESVHLEVATYYQAGVQGTRVGGDWFDVIDLGAGRTALVIGDVSGRGIRAASLMGQLRAAGRAYARLDLPPGEILELLEATVLELGQGHLATCIYCVHDPVAGDLRYANAGHLPPLLALPGEGAMRLPGTPDPPLGFGSSQFHERRLELTSGALIVLYTDGLVERRDRDLDTGIDMLATHVRADVPTVQGLPAELVQAVAPQGNEDDIAILVARISDRSVERVAVLDLLAKPSSVKQGRVFTTTTLREWSLADAVIEDATLMVSEMLTNAVVHGRPPVRLRLRKTSDELTIEVDDGSSAMPRRLRAGPDDLHGRGLAIVAELGARWAARPDGYGKTVWSTIPIPPG